MFFSRRWKEMLGFTEDEISNTLEEWSKRVHPEDLGWVTETIQDHFAGKTPFYISEHRVLIVEIQPNNTALPISEAILPDLTPMLGYELADPLLMGKYLARYHQGKVLAIDNLATASINPDTKQLLQQFQVQAKLVLPILSQGENSKITGIQNTTC